MSNAGRRPMLAKKSKTREKLVELIRAGNYVTTSCKLVGISESAYYLWKKKGEEELERRDQGEKANKRMNVYVEFVEDIARAEAEAEAGSIVRIQGIARNMEHDPNVRLRAEQFLLERRFRERWGRDKLDVIHRGEVTLELDIPEPAVLTAGNQHDNEDESEDAE